MKAQKQKRINLYSVKGAWRLDQSIQSKIIALAFSLAAEIERDLISQRTKEALRFKKAQGMKLGRPTAPAKRKLDPYRPEIENLLANGSTQSLSPVATTQPRPIVTKHGLKLSKDLVPVLTSPKGIHADALNIRQTTKAVGFLCEIFMTIQAMLLTVLGTAAVCLTGCATNPPVFTSQQLATAHYGQPLTIDWQVAVKGWFLKKVTDPLSAQYIFNGPPHKGYIHTPLNGTIFAYFTVVRVNAKDSSGTYLSSKTITL